MNKPHQEIVRVNLIEISAIKTFKTRKKLKKTLKSGKMCHAHGLTKLIL